MIRWELKFGHLEVKDSSTVAEVYLNADDIWVDAYGWQERCCNSEEVNISFSVPLNALCALLERRGYMLVKKEAILNKVDSVGWRSIGGVSFLPGVEVETGHTTVSLRLLANGTLGVYSQGEQYFEVPADALKVLLERTTNWLREE